MRRASWGVLPVALAALAAGCGPSRILPNPPGLPPELNGRRLWNTPWACIYARDKATAGETDRWVHDLAGHIRRTYRGELGKGLVIVTDVDEATPAIVSLAELHRLEERYRAPNDRPMTLDERRLSLAERGLTEQQACLAAITALDDAATRAMGFPDNLPTELTWRMCCPSSRLALRITREIAPAAVERKKGKAFAVLAAPFLPVATLEAAKAFDLARDATAFDLWARRQADWDEARRNRETLRYMRERALLLSPVLSMALTLAERERAAQGPRATLGPQAASGPAGAAPD